MKIPRGIPRRLERDARERVAECDALPGTDPDLWDKQKRAAEFRMRVIDQQPSAWKVLLDQFPGDVSLCVPIPNGYDAGGGLEDSRNPPVCGLPSGRMSLLDMMNFSLHDFVWAQKLLAQEALTAALRSSKDPDATVTDEDKERVIANLNYVSHVCNKMLLSGADNRLGRIFTDLRTRSPIFCAHFAQDLTTLREAIEDDIKTEYFFHYRRDRAVRLLTFAGEWGATLTAFPSVRDEIERGIDCYALEDYAASVFHMMRVAEIGMRALARERKVTFPNHPLEWAEWQRVIDQIDTNARPATAGMGRGPARDAANAFYTGALAQLRALKETRNRAMHMRGPPFDELDALRAINQVRDFMNGLSAKIGETTRRPIRRWP